MSGEKLPANGAENLLTNCLTIVAESKVLLVCEDTRYGWYDDAAREVLGTAIQALGAHSSSIMVGSPDDPLPDNYHNLISTHDTIIFLARIGDQDRFSDTLPGKQVAMLYCRDHAALTSPFAALHHAALKDLKTAIDRVTLTATSIKITCSLGTDLTASIAPENLNPEGEVTIKRFPLCVPQPVLATQTSGKVALSGWLTPTGSQSYTPASCSFESVVFAHVANGRITSFDGDEECVSKIEAHYEHVANTFDIEKDVVHSWHAGIHPACFYNAPIADDPDRWSNNIFGSPRYLHFHSCGNYPPGEICWMVRDPTIEIDGKPLWQKGRLVLENFLPTAAVLENWPELRHLIAAPLPPIGSD